MLQLLKLVWDKASIEEHEMISFLAEGLPSYCEPVWNIIL